MIEQSMRYRFDAPQYYFRNWMSIITSIPFPLDSRIHGIHRQEAAQIPSWFLQTSLLQGVETFIKLSSLAWPSWTGSARSSMGDQPLAVMLAEERSFFWPAATESQRLAKSSLLSRERLCLDRHPIMEPGGHHDQGQVIILILIIIISSVSCQ